MLKALRRAQQNEIDTNTQYTNLIDNMPILYMKEQVIWDKEGNIIDSIYRDVNRYFERCFLPKSDIIGKRASEIFPEPCRNSPIHEYHLKRKENRSPSHIILRPSTPSMMLS